MYEENSLNKSKIEKPDCIIDISKEQALPKKVAIEGVAAYKNNLFMIDEKNSKVFNYNLNTKTLREIDVPNFTLNIYPWDTKNEYGLEGIAIDSNNRICYILREKVFLNKEDRKNKKWHSVIYSFEIKTEGDICTLTFLDSINIKNGTSRWRCSDIVYDSASNSLFMLKVSYWEDSACNKSQYHVYKLPVITMKHKTGIIKPVWGSPSLVDSINVCIGEKDNYPDNIEGIFIKKNWLYSMSDNDQSDNYDCNTKSDSTKKTFFSKQKLSSSAIKHQY